MRALQIHRAAHISRSLRGHPRTRFPLHGHLPSSSSSPSSSASRASIGRLRQQATCLCSGFGAGLFGSLVGLGGGFVIIPALTAFARFSQHQAHGTSLVAVVATSATAAAAYFQEGQVDMGAAAVMAAAGVLTAPLGAKFSSRLSPGLLSGAMGAFMIVVAPSVPLKPWLLKNFTTDASADSSGHCNGNDGVNESVADEVAAMPQQRHKDNNTITGYMQDAAREFHYSVGQMTAVALARLGAIGAGTGFASGLFGVGGGSIMTPSLALCTDMSQHTVIGTSLLAMLLPSAVGAVSHARLGNVVLWALPPVVGGTALGAYAGAKLGLSLPEQDLRLVFGCLMAFLGYRQVVKARASLAAERLARAAPQVQKLKRRP